MRYAPLTLGVALLAVAQSAQAAPFYPFYSGAAHQRGQSVATYAATAPDAAPALPANVVPPRYYAPSYGAAPTYNNTPAPVAYAAPLPPTANITPLPQTAVTAPPAYAVPAPVYAAQPTVYAAASPPPAPYEYAPAAPQAAPVAEASAFNRYYQPAATSTKPHDRFYIGADSFYDRYRERSADLTNNGLFGSLEYGYTHYFNPRWFAMFEGRSSYGRVNYSSTSGDIAQITDYEFDHSLSAGYDVDYGGGRHFKPYLGIGARYYDDEAKGGVTSGGVDSNGNPCGCVGYDRRFLQFYMPVGMAYEMPAWGYNFKPLLEFAPLLYGYGESRFQNLGGQKLSHVQDRGYRLRAELMFADPSGHGWEFGPFLRYWDVRQSNLDTNSSVYPDYYVEPDNTRLQVGASAKWVF